jgi:hypothetical protein
MSQVLWPAELKDLIITRPQVEWSSYLCHKEFQGVSLFFTIQ